MTRRWPRALAGCIWAISITGIVLDLDGYPAHRWTVVMLYAALALLAGAWAAAIRAGQIWRQLYEGKTGDGMRP